MRPMKDRTDAYMVQILKDIDEYLDIYKCKPKLHVLDNECSQAVKTYINKEDVRVQLMEPHNH